MFNKKIFIDVFDNLPFLLMSFYICFATLMRRDSLYLSIVFISFFIWFIFHRQKIKLYFNKFNLFWILFSFYLCLSIFFSISTSDSIKFSFVFLFIILISIGLSFVGEKKYYERFLNYILFFSLIHTFFTFLNVFNIDLVISINKYFFDYQTCLQIKRWAVEFNNYAGIAGQVGTNAIIQSFILCISSMKWLYSKERKYAVFFMLALAALLLTGKETFYLANIIAIFLISSLYLIKNNILTKKIFFKICLFSISAILIILILNINYIYEIFYNTSIKSRLILYNDAINAFNRAPLLGNGISTIGFFSDHLTHNIYLQLLAEVGIIGLFLFLISISKSLIDIVKKYWYTSNHYFNMISLYLLVILIVDGFFGNLLFDYKFISLFFIVIFSINLSENKNGDNDEQI